RNAELISPETTRAGVPDSRRIGATLRARCPKPDGRSGDASNEQDRAPRCRKNQSISPWITNSRAIAHPIALRSLPYCSPIAPLLLHGRRFGFQRHACFSRRSRIFAPRSRVPAPPARAIAGGLPHSLFDRLRLLGRAPGDLIFNLLPGSLYRLLFNLPLSLKALSTITITMSVTDLYLQLRDKFDGALQFLFQLLFAQLTARFFDHFLDAPYQIAFAFRLFVLCLFVLCLFVLCLF